MRSSLDYGNLDALLKAQANPGKLYDKGQQQYSTPGWMCHALNAQLPEHWVANVLDPQCAGGNTMLGLRANLSAGIEIDKRQMGNDDSVIRINGNCVDVDAVWEELYPQAQFACINANPPFGMSWKTPKGNMDSTLWTWEFVQRRSHCRAFGFFIAGKSTLEKLEIHKHPNVYLYQTFAPGMWEGVRIDIGIVHWSKHQFSGRREFSYGPEFFTLGERERTRAMMDNCYLPRQTMRAERPQMIMNQEQWETIQAVVHEDAKKAELRCNIDVDKNGILRTFLSTRAKLKLDRKDFERLAQVDGSNPLTLTTERETRKLLAQLVDSKAYSISVEAQKAMRNALDQVALISAPIRPVSDFGAVAYAEEEDHLEAIEHTMQDMGDGKEMPQFTAGKKYEFQTGTYNLVRNYKRSKVKYTEDRGTYSEPHDCQLTGVDRYIRVEDDTGSSFRFMEHPETRYDIPESLLWKFFKRVEIPTIVDIHPEAYQANLQTMEMNELLAGFQYFEGQRDYYARMAIKDYGLVGADVGTGKSLGAITLHSLKHTNRTLIVAPQGTMRGPDGQMEDFDNAAQWVKELRKFVPTEPVFQLFNEEEYRKILKANHGQLPHGIYITYPTAMYRNKSYEFLPPSWEHMQMCRELDLDPGPVVRKADLLCLTGPDANTKRTDVVLPPEMKPKSMKRGHVLTDANGDKHSVENIWDEAEWDFTQGVGVEHHGIRCIATPTLATIIEEEERLRKKDRSIVSPWDMILLDEGHMVCHLTSKITQTFIRQQPKFRFVLTATPIPNLVTDIFALMGWLSVPGWHQGDKLNAAWPYKTGDITRFQNTFLCTEEDITQKIMDVRSGKRSTNNKSASPIISSPARLLKLVSHTLAYISKEQCNPNQVPAEIIDVRVPMGRQQIAPYGFFMNRGNICYSKGRKQVNPMVRAMMQSGILRGICADPKGWTYEDIYTSGNCPPELAVNSNFNPKTATILQLVHERMACGEQVVIVNARVGQTDELAARLDSAGIKYSRIDSKVKPSTHAIEANRFKSGETRVMLMGIKCAQGYSFEQCSNLIVGSLEWSYGTLHQALGRIHRLTSPKAVKVWVVLHSNSIEEALYDRVAQKKDAATICLRGERMPSDYKTFDAEEVLAEHIVAFHNEEGKWMDESECEQQWPQLLKELRAVA